MPLKVLKKPDFKKIKRRVSQAYEQELYDIGDELIAIHKKYVKNWNHQPYFVRKIVTRGPLKTVRVEVVENEDGLIWKGVCYGTGVYGPSGQEIKIRPKKAGGVLSITLGYSPKTTPQGSTGGSGSYAGPTIFRKFANVKGIKPRRFDRKALKDLVKKKGKNIFSGLAGRMKKLVRG